MPLALVMVDNFRAVTIDELGRRQVASPSVIVKHLYPTPNYIDFDETRPITQLQTYQAITEPRCELGDLAGDPLFDAFHGEEAEPVAASTVRDDASGVSFHDNKPCILDDDSPRIAPLRELLAYTEISDALKDYSDGAAVIKAAADSMPDLTLAQPDLEAKQGMALKGNVLRNAENDDWKTDDLIRF
jgi:hypothetical protein